MTIRSYDPIKWVPQVDFSKSMGSVEPVKLMITQPLHDETELENYIDSAPPFEQNTKFLKILS